jgi:chemotaxis protein methyltransferase CheR
MLMRQSFPQLADWNIRILASDLNPNVVAKAKKGVYTALEVNRGLPAPMLVKFFSQHGDLFFINDDLKSCITFFEQNLITSWSIPQVDILFMRNVLIYFDTETKKQLFENIKGVLAPDGYLFLGTAESPYRVVEGFSKVEGGANIYRRD